MNVREQIRKALDEATPGPWNLEGEEIWKRGDGYNGSNPHVWICDVQGKHNAHLIANAPQWLEYLLQENQRYREALKFYATESTYDIEHLDKHGYIIIDQDGGKKARQALKKEGESDGHS